MFDLISYAAENNIKAETYPVKDPDGFVIRLRDLRTAATESTVIQYKDLTGLARPGLYIEQRLDSMLSMIGKRRAEHEERERASKHRNDIEGFFRGR